MKIWLAIIKMQARIDKKITTKNIIVKNKFGASVAGLFIVPYHLVKETILRNKYGRKFLKSIILISRKFSFEPFFASIAFQRGIRAKILRSPLFLDILLKYENLLERFLERLAKLSIKRNDRHMIFKIAQVYRYQRQHEKAFNLLYPLLLKALQENQKIKKIIQNFEHNKVSRKFKELSKTQHLNEIKIEQYLVKSLQAEAQISKDEIIKLYKNKKNFFHDKARYLMQCQFTLKSDDVKPEWNKILKTIEQKFDFLLVNWLILAALGHQKTAFLQKIGDLLISQKGEYQSGPFQRSITVLAAAYYRTGDRKKLKQLDKLFRFDVPSWKIYMCFGQGKIMDAMDHRAKVIKQTFLRSYPYKINSKKQILTPEKDICGEAFNSLYYRALQKSNDNFYVVCDRRLLKILKQNFPLMNFIPKTPRYMQEDKSEKFNHLNYGLRDFLDNKSLKKTMGANFFTIDYSILHKRPETQEGRTKGWLKPDNKLRDYWKKKLGSHKKLIGVCSNSTVRSRIRDMHMVSIDRWGKIFKLPDCKFINLNASLTAEEINEYSKKFKIEFINPDIDLFNDFDNLLSIMSLLDVAIVPPNNMMDFSAALGIKTIVFSPSNIMKAWAIDDNKYIFSENVKFIFPEQKINKLNHMVAQAVTHIKELKIN